MNYLNDIVKELLSLGTESLVILLVIGVAYVPRVVPGIPNKVIPWLCSLVLGPTLYTLLKDPGKCPPDLYNPVVWKVGIGFILGLIAWILHDKLISRIENWLAEKMPVVGKILNTPDKPVEPPKTP